ncbi:MAG: hypothetical protein K2H91_03810 [Lachnospiraceae bacterium]|nr:hypothetical protein [Lachnospiraceae bacterium]
MNYVEVYKSVLDFHRKYSQMTGTDKEWEELVKEADGIARKFGNGRFVRDLILAVQNEIKRKLEG